MYAILCMKTLHNLKGLFDFCMGEIDFNDYAIYQTNAGNNPTLSTVSAKMP